MIAEKERVVSERAADRKKIDELSSMNEELTANVKELSDLLEAETKRVDSLGNDAFFTPQFTSLLPRCFCL